MKRLIPYRSLVIAAAVIFGPAAARAESPRWSQFRGVDGNGVMIGDLDLTAVGDPDRLLWRTAVRGVGWSSPVGDAQRLFLTTSETTLATPAERLEALSKVAMPNIKDVAGSVELFAVAIDSASGEMLWRRSLDKIDEPGTVHPMNSYASPTPLLVPNPDGDRVVFHFGGYGTWCLDAETGDTAWTQQLVVDDSVGPGSSPVRYQDRLIVACDGIDRQFVAALSLADGSVLWKSPRPPMRAALGEYQKAYSTPLVITVDSRVQVVVPGAQWTVAYDPESGEEIWRVDHGNGFSVTPMPLLARGLVIFSTGYVRPELVAVDPVGVGDISNTHVRWRQPRGAPTKPSFVADDRMVYLVSDDGIVSACTLTDGLSKWRKRVGGTFSASPILAGNQVLLANHDGEVTVFGTGDEFKLLHQTDLGEQIMASPIAIDGDVIVRTKYALYRYDTVR